MAEQKSQKGANDIIMKRKIYQQLLDWKEKRNGEVALLVEGARRIGKSYIVEEFARNEYESYILIDFNKAPQMVRDWFDLYLEDLDTLFLYLSQHYKVRLHERKSLIILDEIQLCPRARAAIKFLVADRRYDYIETGSLVSIRKNTQGIDGGLCQVVCEQANIRDTDTFQVKGALNFGAKCVVSPDVVWYNNLPYHKIMDDYMLIAEYDGYGTQILKQIAK